MHVEMGNTPLSRYPTTFNELDLALRERQMQIAIRVMYRREAGLHDPSRLIERRHLYIARHLRKKFLEFPRFVAAVRTITRCPQTAV